MFFPFYIFHSLSYFLLASRITYKKQSVIYWGFWAYYGSLHFAPYKTFFPCLLLLIIWLYILEWISKFVLDGVWRLLMYRFMSSIKLEVLLNKVSHFSIYFGLLLFYSFHTVLVCLMVSPINLLGSVHFSRLISAFQCMLVSSFFCLLKWTMEHIL